ncbi:MAG: hypothetical protein QXI27_02240 [Nitrososphaerota archaeon]
MRWLLANFAIGLLVTMMLISAVNGANGFNVLKDDNLMIKLSYPVEAEVESCIKINVEVTTLRAVENLTVILKLTYVADSTLNKFFDKKLIDNVDTDGPELVYSKTLNVCLPTVTKPDPYVKAEVAATYSTIDDSNLYGAFYMLTVRSPTYSQLLSQYNEAKKTIDALKSEISGLKLQIELLNNELDSAREANAVLSAKLFMINKNYEELKKKYEEVLKKYEDLNTQYINLVQDYGSLKGTYEVLMKNYETLQKDYQDIRRDYELVSRELSTLQAFYNDLKVRHSDLQESYGEAVKMIGELKGIADERERNLNILQAMLSQAASEGNIVKSLAAAQAVGLAGIGGYLVYRKKAEKRRPVEKTKEENKVSSSEDSSVKVSEAKQDATSSVDIKITKPLKILSGRRVTIPMKIADELGLKVGDLVRVYKNGEYVIIKPERDHLGPNNGQNLSGPS